MTGRISSAEWQVIKELFHELAELPEAERRGRLDELARHDARAAAELEALLAVDDDPALRDVGTDAMAGTKLGNYVLEHVIGSGGMGTVYLATRKDGAFEQQVAIKIVRRGMDTEHVLRRFVAERRILATLSHPFIARLLDGGETPDGRPYLVMERIDGTRVDEYLRAHPAMPIEQRLRLFRDICAAVHYAHQKLVVHRDLKPANILVTAGGTPALLDFGIAKLLGDSDGQATATAAEQRILTPGYASPEQLLGQPLSTASDVYSLGVILYEMLTGARPRRNDPERPSVVAARAGDPQLARRLRGDLDTIVLVALRNDPSRRYASAFELSSDIERFCERLPIRARPDDAVYRARKFLARNRVMVSAATAIALSLLGGMLVALHQARVARMERARAERRVADVHRLARALLFDVYDAVAKLPGSIPVRRVMVADSLAYLDSLSRETGSQPAMRLEVAMAYERVGALAFDMERELSATAKANAIYRELVAIEPSNFAFRSALITNLQNLGDLNKAIAEIDAAYRASSESLRLAEAFARDYPNDPRAVQLLARALEVDGFIAEDVGEHGHALARYRQAAAVAERLAALAPQDIPLLRRRPVVYTHVGINLSELGSHEEALRHLERAQALVEELRAADAVSVVLQRDAWQVHLALGTTHLRAGRVDVAERHLAEAFALKRELANSDPLDTGHQRGLAVTHRAVGDALRATGRLAAARAEYERAAEISARLMRIDPRKTESRIDLGETQLAIARLGDAAALKKAIALLRGLPPRHLRAQRALHDAHTLEKDLS